MEIIYSSKAAKFLKKLSKGDKKSVEMIINAIEEYALNPQGSFDIQFLKGEYSDLKRLRVGQYPIIFDTEENILSILKIYHRQGAYP
ncbi:MAG TPA: type II toxin-antitoxin system RelE/ParE family toxin [Spirochaetes bacterium]|nr:type II toxin-antitoxin system RelE/ParE family toxin [Spirochaetota bacterium]